MVVCTKMIRSHAVDKWMSLWEGDKYLLLCLFPWSTFNISGIDRTSQSQIPDTLECL